MRLVALVVVVMFAAPAVGGVICDWTCAAAQAGTTAHGGCHDADEPVQATKLEAGHECHELPVVSASILTGVPHSTEASTAAETAPAPTAAERSGLVVRRADRTHAPPRAFASPLRI